VYTFPVCPACVRYRDALHSALCSMFYTDVCAIIMEYADRNIERALLS